jgi:hypothetical protein
MKIKVRALRQKIWFKALSRVERGLIDLTIRCVERIRSHTLMKAVLAVVDKLLKTLDEEFLQKAERLGRKIVEKVSFVALNWGNRNALMWKWDLDFVRFLGVIVVNEKF